MLKIKNNKIYLNYSFTSLVSAGYSDENYGSRLAGHNDQLYVCEKLIFY